MERIDKEKDAEIARLKSELKDQKRRWRTLKAESGYRTTIDSMGGDKQSLKQLMDNIENRTR
jgi:hypothetical protein